MNSSGKSAARRSKHRARAKSEWHAQHNATLFNLHLSRTKRFADAAIVFAIVARRRGSSLSIERGAS